MDHSDVDVEVDDRDEVVSEDAFVEDAPADDAYAMADVENSDAAERLRGLIVYLATNLVDDPEAVEVEARQRGGSVFVSLRVPEEELGKVIGRGGRIARAMRTALMISGSRSNVRASLDIED
ncbi:MAG: KH domain-containing protein [Thermomicrobiales bacterium]